MYNTIYHNQPLSDKTILVVGGAGFIGSHITEYLLKHGAKVVVIDNLSTGFIENIELFSNNPNYTFIKGDISDFDTCKKACEGIDIICHQAALGAVPRSVAHPELTTLHNVVGFVNMATAARDAGIKRFVYASSSSVYGDDTTLPKVENRIGKPLSPYAITKLVNEMYAENFALLYGMEFIGFRYFNVFGPRQSPKGTYAAVIPLFIEACIQNDTCFINGDGSQTRDFTFVENVVQFNVKAMLTDNPAALNQVYNVGCGENITVNELFEGIKQRCSSSSNVQHREPRKGDVPHSLADISKSQELLGYDPLFKMNEGLDITVKSFLK